jgi:hypothetical protein
LMANANIIQAAAYLRRAAEDYRMEISRRRSDKAAMEQKAHSEAQQKELELSRRRSDVTRAQDGAVEHVMALDVNRIQHDIDQTRQEAAGMSRRIDQEIRDLEARMNDLMRRASDLESSA